MQSKGVRIWVAAAIVMVSGGLVSDAFAQAAGASSYKYSMKIVPTFPKGSAAEKLTATQPSNTKFTPCDPSKVDAVTFTMTYDAGNPTKAGTMHDVYVLIFTPNGGSNNVTQYQVGVRQPLNAGWLAFEPIDSIDELTTNKATMMYLPRSLNPSGKVTENLVMANLGLDGVPKGTWQIVGIIADSTSSTLDFGDSNTWDAWDVATVVVGQPWLTGDQTKDTCN